MKKTSKGKKQNPAAELPDKSPPTIIHTFNYDKWFPWIVAIFGLILYFNTINHQYVLDDETVIGKNKIVTKGIKAIPEIMTTAYRKGAWDRQESLYRPLSLVFFAIEWQLAPNHPLPGHFINILLYALTGLLLYKLLRKWLRQKHPLIPFSIALLFIAHPLHTEVISNIKSLDEILGFLFGLLAMSSFYEYAAENKNKYLISGALFFMLALLSKENSITLLAAIPLSQYFFCKIEEKKKYIFTFISLFGVVVIYFLMRKIALGSLVNFNKIDVLNNALIATANPLDRFATAIVLVGYYIRLFFFPHPLSFDYSYNTIPVANLGDYRFLLSMLAIILLAIYALKNFRKKDPAAFGILFFAITISIVSNVFILIEATLAERFVYMPSLGFCMLVVLWLERRSKFVVKKHSSVKAIITQNKLYSGILFIILILFSIKTFTRNLDWKNNFTLFSTDKDHNPDSYRTLSAYPLELYRQKIFPLPDGDTHKLEYCKEAIEYLNKSFAIIPDNFKGWNLLAYCQLQLKNYPLVVYAYENGIKYYKDEPDWDKFQIMGITGYYFTGNYNKAIEISKASLEKEPKNATLWNCLGMNLTEVGRRQPAIDALNKSLQLDSTQAITLYNIGNWYAKGVDFPSAIIYYEKALEKDPKHIDAMNNAGNCYAVLKQYDKALYYFHKILTLQPGNEKAMQNVTVINSHLAEISK
ncbi:MAG: repeat-containing protein YrrB [Bacteroidota bacterium]|nr:repeat-containing protein YrrB [Bacteroidota bacterium]